MRFKRGASSTLRGRKVVLGRGTKAGASNGWVRWFGRTTCFGVGPQPNGVSEGWKEKKEEGKKKRKEGKKEKKEERKKTEERDKGNERRHY